MLAIVVGLRLEGMGIRIPRTSRRGQERLKT